MQEDGRITGVLAEDKQGNDVQISAGAVVLATAGFNDDAEMVRQHSHFGLTLDRTGTCEEGNVFFLCPDLKLSGDGIKMAWEAGADKGAIGVHVFPHVPQPGIHGNMPWLTLSQARILQEQPHLWVNQLGRRFMDEGLVTDHMTSGVALVNQKGKCAFLIFDEATKRHMEEVGLDFIYFIFPAEKLTDVEGDLRNLIAQGNKHIFIAETLQELAVQDGCPSRRVGADRQGIQRLLRKRT